MSGSYEFCVSRTRESGEVENFPARYRYGDIDPGKEVARVLVTQRFRQDGKVRSVGASDYSPERCPGTEVQEFTVSLSGDQLQSLANAIGSGDVVGAAAVATEVVVGVTVTTVKEVGKALDKVGDALGDLVGGATNAVNDATEGAKNFLKKPFG